MHGSSEYQIAHLKYDTDQMRHQPPHSEGIVFLNKDQTILHMKINGLLLGIFMAIALHSCQSDNRESNESNNANEQQANTKEETPVKMMEILIGEWQLANGATGGGNAGQGGGPVERIRFTEEARYIGYSGNQKVDSGAYRMNEQLRNLYLESEATEQPREYEISLQQDALTLKPRQPQAGQDAASYTYRRVGPASVPPDKAGGE